MPSSAQIETLRQLFETVRDERRTYANTATRIGNAFLALLSYVEDAPYIHKDRADETEYLLKLLAGAIIGESGEIKLNPDGSIVCQSIHVNGSAIFDELVFNHQNVLEGDTYFTDRGIVESVQILTDSTAELTFRKEYDDDHVTFHVNDILLGKVNNLDQGKTFRSVWLRIDEIDTDANTAVCSIYPDADVPGGKNYMPVAAMRVIRWGNTIDTSRQCVWFVSSTEGRWLFLQGVSRPILEDTANGSNYAGFIGLPPDIEATRDLLQKKIISADQPYLYFRGIMVQDLIKVDYLGNPEYTARDLGMWNASQKYIKGYDETARGYYVDRVWWGGCLWQCSTDECSGSEPRFNNTDWTCLLGGSNMAIYIVSSSGNFFRANTTWQTDLVASVWNAEMKLTEDEIGIGNVTWTRSSDDTDGDTAWNKRHTAGADGLTLHIDSTQDLPSTWTSGSVVGYECTVTFPDGSEYSNSYEIVK